MVHRFTFKLSVCVCVVLTSAAFCLAFTVLSKEEALKEIFPSGVKLQVETKELAGKALADIKEKLGGNLEYYQEGSESEKVEAETKIDFHFAEKDGEKIGVALFDTEPGRWGPVEFAIAMDIKGTVKAVRVLSYEEQRGRPIAQRSFVNQYRGKTVNSALTVGRDIIGVSGATISSRAATFAVKKALVIYNELYLNK